MPISRRSFLLVAGALATPLAGRAIAKPIELSPAYSDPEVTDNWIMQWMQSPQSVTKSLHLGRFADRVYFLREEIGWSPNPGQESLMKVQVPAGFVTDFASIPRMFWTLLPPDGLYTYPAIIHDYLYWEQPVSREDADLILQYAMQDFKINAATIKTIYTGVRVGGSSAWKDNAALKQSGEKRVLKNYPTDPTTRWGDWRNNLDNY
ncbi:hypothetical protein PS903_03021 [Pseudomonas fluorescens]|nr:hypothetical protein PS903_03021 [Pseudomonas fluorescens]